MTAPAPSFGERFRLTLITADPDAAARADEAGVDRAGIDIELLGKADRQAGHDTRLSRHGWDGLAAVAGVVRRASPFVRINPVHAGTGEEIETALRLGARVIMLPSFRSAGEVERFTGLVRGRATAVLLLELAPAVARVREILAVPGVDEVMLGLNDLHLQFGLANHFEMLVSPVVDMLAEEVRRAGLPLAIGGLTHPDETSLPVPPDLVYAQYPRLGAGGAWIARSFRAAEWPAAIQAMRRRLDRWAQAPPEEWEQARRELACRAAEWRPAPADKSRA
ncbi:MAG: aldolase [Acidobacteria bacterium]|nr:aldolase [Acidobacteriota bacterium]